MDEKYILKKYGKKILARFSGVAGIKAITVVPHKKNIWETTYHVVIEYRMVFLLSAGGEQVVPIFCAAHSCEPRKNVYDSLKFLSNHGFALEADNQFVVPRPLFYSKYFRGTFYVGVVGRNLYHFIKENNRLEIEKIVRLAAGWFAKLHRTPTDEAWNFNRDNSRLRTVRPGMKVFFEKIKESRPRFHNRFKKVYEKLNLEEEKFLAISARRWVVHGDAHPENIIKMGRGRLAAIDFADLCLADFARDLGSFLQQLDFKIMRYVGDRAYAEKVKKLFLNNYLKDAKIELNDSLAARIERYYLWASLRTAAYFLLRHLPDPARAESLIIEAYGRLFKKKR